MRNLIKRGVTYLFFVLIFFLFACGLSSADTYVSGGNIYSEHWTHSGSPYRVTGDITIPAESFSDLNRNGVWDSLDEPYEDSNENGQYDLGEPFTDIYPNGRWDQNEPFDDINGNNWYDSNFLLRIDPGVEVIFNDGVGLNVEGTLSAEGTYDQPIIMTSTSSEGWGGLIFTGRKSDDSVLAYVQISSATPDVLPYGAIYINNSSPYIHHCWIHDNFYGIRLDNESAPIIENNRIENNTGAGIYLSLIHI